MAYTTPPGSGNAYSWDFVKEAYAMAPSTMQWSDDVLVILAPILGDVVTIRKPLARYRIHAANYSAVSSLKVGQFRDRLQQDVGMARLFITVLQQRGLAVPRDPLRRSVNHLQYRLASYSIEPDVHPFEGDRLSALAYSVVRSAALSPQLRLRDKTLLIAWAIACGLAPQYFRRKLILWRFAPTSRPALVKTLLRVLSSLRGPRPPDRA